MPITEEQHAEIQNIGLLRAALTLIEKCGPTKNRETRDLLMAARDATSKALRQQWADTDEFTG